MNWLRRRKSAPVAPAEPVAPCLHAVLVPRWDSAQDIGHDDRASYFMCDACKTQFSPAEAAALREQEAERLREMLS